MIRITGLPAPKSQLVTPVIRRIVSVTEIKSRAMAIARKVLGVISRVLLKKICMMGKILAMLVLRLQPVNFLVCLFYTLHVFYDALRQFPGTNCDLFNLPTL